MAKPKKKDTPLRKYPVLQPLKHDGEDYEVGDTVEMHEGDAERLLGAKVLGPAKADEPAAPKKS